MAKQEILSVVEIYCTIMQQFLPEMPVRATSIARSGNIYCTIMMQHVLRDSAIFLDQHKSIDQHVLYDRATQKIASERWP